MKEEEYSNYRWIIWSTMSIGFLFVFLQRYSIAVVSNDLSAELNLTGLQLSNLSSMYFYAYALMQIPVGIMADTIGPRKIVSWGMLLAAVGSIMFSLGESITFIFFSRFLIGIGVSTVFVSIMKIIAVWFPPQEFATLAGWTNLVGNIGGMLASSPLALLVTLIGWRLSFRSIGISTFFIAFLLWWVVKDYPPGKSQTLLPETPNEQSNNAGILVGLKKVIGNSQLWIVFFIFFGIMGTVMSFSGLWGIPYLMHVYDMSRNAAANNILFLTLGVTFGSLIVGRVEKLFKSGKSIIQLITFLFTTFWGILIFLTKCKPDIHLIPFLFFCMGVLGIHGLVVFVIAKETNSPQYYGLITGFINVAPFAGVIVLNTLIGLFLDLNWNGLQVEGVRIYSITDYQKGLLVYFCFSLLSFLLSIIFLKDKSTSEITKLS